jgi:hypothetical protein
MNDWLSTVQRRLADAGYVIREDVPLGDRTFPLVARRTAFQLTKFGSSESFFIFAEFEQLDKDSLRRFSADAFRCALRDRIIPLPRGWFESVWCYAVAITRAADDATLNSVRNDTPPRHWASGEIPVVYDLTQRKLVYFEKTPIWGAAYYRGFRKTIRRLLEENG